MGWPWSDASMNDDIHRQGTMMDYPYPICLSHMYSQGYEAQQVCRLRWFSFSARKTDLGYWGSTAKAE